MKNRGLIISGGIIVVSLALVAIFAPFISTYDPGEIDVDNILTPPSKIHILGTDSLGRDLFSRMVYGTQVSLFIGFVAVGISVLIGIVFGSIAGYYGGRIDALIMRFVDVMLCFPTLFLILAVVAILEPSLNNTMIVIGLTSWMGTSRLIRAEILSIKERGFIHAEQALGASDFRIVSRYLIPNAIGPVLISAILGISSAILLESGLSFLGLGVQPPTPSWGNILIEGKSTLDVAWWITICPGVAILVAVLGYNLLGEGLRKWLS